MPAPEAKELGVVDEAVSPASSKPGSSASKGKDKGKSNSKSNSNDDAVLSAALSLVVPRASTAGETLRLLKCQVSAEAIRTLAPTSQELARISRSFL